jgi:hypothetical protein
MAALAEMRRTLAPGCRLAVSTWRTGEKMAVLRALRAIAERHVGYASGFAYEVGANVATATL